jgi:hypothetical protein
LAGLGATFVHIRLTISTSKSYNNTNENKKKNIRRIIEISAERDQAW